MRNKVFCDHDGTLINDSYGDELLLLLEVGEYKFIFCCDECLDEFVKEHTKECTVTYEGKIIND